MKCIPSGIGPHFVGALLLGSALLAVPSSAGANSAGHAYSSCQEDSGTPNAYNAGGNILTANSLVVACPVSDFTGLARSTLTTLDLFYDDETSSGYVMAFRCVDYESAVGGSCGDTVQSSSSGTGVSSLHVPKTPSAFTTDWNGGGFGYVEVILPPKSSSGGISRIKGLYEVN